MFGSSVDFSFKEINTISDVLSDVPNSSAHPPKRDSKKKFISMSFRLNNNSIKDLTGLMDTLSALFSEPTRLAWLDLSFNEIKHIDSVLTQLKELRLLYLHGNNIQELSEVDKLAVLPSLHTITLHGNPIVSERDYRAHLIAMLPHVKMIDFSAVTKQERELTSVWQKSKNTHKSTGYSKSD
ncbi:leucine-rich repeat-containing protein 51 [Danio rerio]|uniref:Leucine-rich repeat-containing protein 51 n=1 Tax=Danio rerio TaxID=7955 RepID=Q08C25_DANRE|nr:leucine rich repeat containing 51 [Danio rerio]AAI24443.1 Zgc:153736 [Danio rerio]|eukprot:NP_001070236.1 leucine-rich repeat-containing protein 51 [Danio rerio]